MTAEPTDTTRLRLQQELRDIKLGIPNHSQRFLFDYVFSARSGDISQAIHDFKPDVVHFSGHGNSTGELYIENELGQQHPLTPKALAALFELVADTVKCVVLNACYSDIQARAIVKYIPFVIGMRKEIGDNAAIAFAVGFYKALAANCSIEDAYKFGRTEIQLKGIPEELTPFLRKRVDKYRADLYVPHLSIERECFRKVLQGGSLIRIKAPDNMGKTSLMNRIVSYVRENHNYQIVTLSCHTLVDSLVSNDLERFLKSFCFVVSSKLKLPDHLDEYWNNPPDPIYKTGDYFERHLLAKTPKPLLLALDDADLVFEQPKIANQFCIMLRNWYDRARRSDLDSEIWDKLRLIIVHSTEFYAELDINTSPLGGVGKVVDLPELNLEQVQRLVTRHRLSWSEGQVEQLMAMLGGHPLLLGMAADYVKRHRITLEELLQEAPTVAGPFSDHLRELLEILQQKPDLQAAFSQVVNAHEDNTVELNPIPAKSLQRLGLVKLDRDFANPRCQLYRQYFRRYL
ncbi:AAA-like domain-containing protein [Aetokthonos hydrillicola Thurmond2011]|uniref:AAA-like domain-containing protein n=1 Tax=Aetokthonos hydrillicola Thurmond2011 TaxID=2712845 RepID=A0AAP5I9I9_9CYAN|nr:AAA-like domain-containing protein [Aetokthonos hydrillicola]MBO3461062.1 CHAT domain-containing protein [Aetokthonos hydrillicola CCALA 1050]MBW4586315.1 AAA-like domain-containing protein [Aetokthonos hydrillicola CCALA 1050]MDR9897443.1 AAA-like domain-containing protein [Aetokthonos hydrillicola Thurmond2011]